MKAPWAQRIPATPVPPIHPALGEMFQKTAWKLAHTCRVARVSLIRDGGTPGRAVLKSR